VSQALLEELLEELLGQQGQALQLLELLVVRQEGRQDQLLEEKIL
jgi:hypothetical protein